MPFEDSDIPIIGKAVLKDNVPTIVTGSGMVVVLDARMKKFLFAIQGRLESIELWGWLSIQGEPGKSQYFVFHACNTKLLDAVYRVVV